MLAGLIIFVWWGASDLILMISLKLIQWYDYIIDIFLGILAIIVFVGIAKNLLAIVFAQRRGGRQKGKVEGWNSSEA